MPLLFLIGLLVASGPRAQPPTADQDPEPYRIKVNVDLVVLHPSVRDGKGGYASDLREQDFEVYEDGVRQVIRLFRHEDIPVTVGLVVDHSGSMQANLPSVIAAARTFVRSSNQEDEVFVVNFSEYVIFGLLGEIRFTSSLDELEAAILRAPARGRTVLYDAIARALVQSQAGSRDKKVLIVISDGADNASVLGLPELLGKAGRTNTLVYPIGIYDETDPDRNPRVLRQLARATGGEAFFPHEVTEVVAICSHIARDIRNQYTIGYVPANPPQPGASRSIRVVAAAKGYGKLFVRTRTSYIAAGDSLPAKDEVAK
jgi:VWFA-related protein